MTSIEERLADQSYINWVKAGLCFNIFKNGVARFAEDESQRLHKKIIWSVSHQSAGASMPPVCGMCTNMSIQMTKKWTIPCPNNICNRYLKEILRYHFKSRSDNIYWENGNVQSWPTDHWSVAKLYMNQGQRDANSPTDCDGIALLNLFQNCIWFSGGSGIPAIVQRIHKCERIFGFRNDIIHNRDMKCSANVLSAYTDDIIDVLQDPRKLFYRQEAKDAVLEIMKVLSADYQVTFRDANEAMIETLCEIRSLRMSLGSTTGPLSEDLFQEIKYLSNLDKRILQLVRQAQYLEGKIELTEEKATIATEPSTEDKSEILEVSISNPDLQPCILFEVSPFVYPRYSYFRRRVKGFERRSKILTGMCVKDNPRKGSVDPTERIGVAVFGQLCSTIARECIAKGDDEANIEETSFPVFDLEKISSLEECIYVCQLEEEFKPAEISTIQFLQSQESILFEENVIFVNGKDFSSKHETYVGDSYVTELKHLFGKRSFNFTLVDRNELPKAIDSLLEKAIMRRLSSLEAKLKDEVKQEKHRCFSMEENIMESIGKIGKACALEVLLSKDYVSGWQQEFMVIDVDKDNPSSIKKTEVQLPCNHVDHCWLCFLLDRTCKQICMHIASYVHSYLSGNLQINPLITTDVTNADLGSIISLNISKVISMHITQTKMFKDVHSHVSHLHTEVSPLYTTFRKEQLSGVVRKDRPLSILKLRFGLNRRPLSIELLANAISNTTDICLQALLEDARERWLRKADRLIWEVEGLYEQSDYKKREYAGQTPAHTDVPDHVVKDLFLKVKEVRGCGYCFGKLKVHVNKDSLRRNKSKIQRQVSAVFERYNINNFELLPFCGLEEPDESNTRSDFKAYFTTGAKIKTSTEISTRHGTLGGFSNMRPDDDVCAPKSLCALVSYHVVKGVTQVSLGLNETEIGTVVDGISGLIDIAAVKIYEQHRETCDTRFKNRNGEGKMSRLFGNAENIKKLETLEVHIWGAESKPGEGIVASSAYVLNSIDDKETLEKLVLIADKDDLEEPVAPFAVEGDSGAIVCADQPDGHVLVLSMLIGGKLSCGKQGGNDDAKYFTFRLKRGLESLAEKVRSIFELCHEVP